MVFDGDMRPPRPYRRGMNDGCKFVVVLPADFVFTFIADGFEHIISCYLLKLNFYLYEKSTKLFLGLQTSPHKQLLLFRGLSVAP